MLNKLFSHDIPSESYNLNQKQHTHTFFPRLLFSFVSIRKSIIRLVIISGVDIIIIIVIVGLMVIMHTNAADPKCNL